MQKVNFFSNTNYQKHKKHYQKSTKESQQQKKNHKPIIKTQKTYQKLSKKTTEKRDHTREFVGVKVVEIVTLSAELNTLSVVSKLLHQERVVLLHDLPYEWPWYCRHFLLLLLCLQRTN